jgi:SAM-dependent methyltransferase
MKTRDSGMPDEAWWSTFFDPPTILHALGLDRITGPVIDVGCGYGTFTLAIARSTQHAVIALDIEPELVADIGQRANALGLSHVRPRVLDVTDGSLGVDAHTADVVLLFNLLHCEKPQALLAATYAALRPGGRVGIIHWRSDVPTPRGPDLSIRPKPEQCRSWLLDTGFGIDREATILPPYHFGLVGIRNV